ncbi:uncharacterized protein LOC135198587 isoform X2 [Macrobrachium nipponense]|uniref:uncharacterized protein LOC135198587 isoform X2 n=1 Tax=Macrobrachium nipponense TaxID=159736 RepID=UPI0030C887D0
MDDDSSPGPTSSGTGRRRRLTKKTSSPRPHPLLLTSESSEDSNPGPIAGPSTESAKVVLERRCKSQSPRKKSRRRGGSRECSKERGRSGSGTRRRSLTTEDSETGRQRMSRSQVAHELKDMLTEGLPEQLQDSCLQLSVSESTGSSRLEHQQSTTSHGSSTMGFEDTLEEGLAAQFRSFSPPQIRHPVYDECTEGHSRLYLQAPGDEESRYAYRQPPEDDEEQQCSEKHSGPLYGQLHMGEHTRPDLQASGGEEMRYASGQPTEEAELRFSFQQHSGPLYGNMYLGSRTSEDKLAASHEGMPIASDNAFEDSLAAQLHALSPQRINRDFGRSEEVSPTGEWYRSRKSTEACRDGDDDNQYVELH